MTNKLQQLQQYTTIVADTGDFSAIANLKPVDATTNPSLLLKAANTNEYQEIVQQIKQQYNEPKQAALQFSVAVGKQILSFIPGRVSTEVDVRLSFNQAATYANAKQIIDLYENHGISRERVLIKIAATWQGIKAAQQLEKEQIKTNLTLLFSFAQAVACADAGVFLISPFVGRIYDWYKKNTNQDYQGANDPGVQSVSRIYRYYKQHGYQTIIMGASFRNVEQIEQLAGCDRLTISPHLLEQLANSQGQLTRKLTPQQPSQEKIKLDQESFLWQHNSDAMATEKLAEGLRLFAQDQQLLENLFI